MANGFTQVVQNAEAEAGASSGGAGASAASQAAVQSVQSSMPTLDQVINLIGAIGTTGQQLGSVIQTLSGSGGTTTRTRCVLGADVPLGLPDTDPRAWIGPINLGIRVAELPEWLDVCSDQGFGASGALYGWQSLGLRAPAPWSQIAASTPGAGVAAQGQAFDQLSPEQQRAYLANAAAIGIAATINNLEAYAPIWAGLVQQQAELGWPDRIGLLDIKGALARLSGRGPALTTAQVGGPVMGGPMDHCFVGDDYAARRECVEKELAANPDAARFYALTQDPWLPVADPNKYFEPLLLAPDGRRYTKIGKGANQRAARTLTVALVTTGTTVVVVGGAVLAFTKAGKKLVKSIFS